MPEKFSNLILRGAALKNFRPGYPVGRDVPVERKILFWFLLACALVLFLLAPVVLHAQDKSNTYNAAQFAGADVGTKVTNAQAQCATNSLPCVVVIDAILAAWPVGTLPAKCATCTWVDYRTSGTIATSGINPSIRSGVFVVDGVIFPTVALAYNACSSSVGGTIEVPAGYSESVLASWTLNKKYCVIHHLGPCAMSFGTNTITVSAGAHGARIYSDIPLGSVVLTQNTGCVYNYTGTGTFITVGASSGDTIGFGLDKIALNLNNAGSAAVALNLVRVQEYMMSDFNCIGPGGAITQQCVILDGTGNFTGGIIRKPRVTGMLKAIQLTGSGANAANANQIYGGNLSSFATGASIGVDFQAGSGGNVIDGTDVEGASIGYNFGGTSQGNSLRVRSETNTSGVTFGASTAGNKVELINSVDPYTLGGTNNTVENRTARTSTNSMVFVQGCSGTATAATTLAIQWTGGACTSASQNVLVPAPNAGTLSNFRVKCNSAGVNASSGVFTLRVNAVNSALTCTVGTGTSCADTTHTVQIAAGDRLQTVFTTQTAETLADCGVSWEKQ